MRKKSEKLKRLLLKLKSSGLDSDLSSLNSDQLDDYVDEMMIDLQNALVSDTNTLRERIKQARPDPKDPQYVEKMVVYKELLKEMVPVMQK
jgi:hypothetical protein